ncbi:cytochrome P450 [Xylariaceae sp. FL1651]|nr:cytochrome P450 [Xylariaceae sp. FL1651]
MNLEGNVDASIAALVRCIRNKVAKGDVTMDIGTLLQYFQVDLITEAGLGAAWGDLAEEKDHYGYLEMADASIASLHTFASLPVVRAINTSSWFLSLFGPKTTDKTGLGLFLGLVEKEVEERFKGNPEKAESRGDMLGEWIKHGLPPKECQLDLAFQIPAGTETSVTTIRGILLLLLSSPPVYQRAKQEIKDGIAAGRISNPVTHAEAKNLKYMQAVLLEGLRLMEPVAFGFPKRVPASGDTICGKAIPGGTDVYPNFASMMRNPDVFGSDALVFRPERFLGSGPDVARMVKTVDFAFGYGRYVCLGKGLAQMEMNKIFIELLRNFDFQIANPEKPWTRVGYTTYMISDFWVQASEATLT